MKRRLDLALALVHEPRVLFLDEPTTGLDPISRRTLWEEVRRLNDEGTTVFLTTQYLEEADQLADRVGIIDEGRLVAEGTPAALKAEIGNPTLTVALADPAQVEPAASALAPLGAPLPAVEGSVAVRLADSRGGLPDAVRRLDTAGVAADGLELTQPSLDDVFLAATGRRLGSDDSDEGATDA
jgi:ABC-2 type transport system ATP-binding protein